MEVVLSTDSHCDTLAHFLHQAAYRHSSIGLKLAPMTPDEGAKAILAGMTSPHKDGGDPEDEDHLLYRPADIEGVWERMREPCEGCAHALPHPRLVTGSAVLAQTREEHIGGGAMQRSLVSTHEHPADSTLMCLAGKQRQGGWLLAGPGWAPMPRCCAQTANAIWTVHYCSTCQRHRASLRTTRPLGAREEVVVDWSPCPDQDRISRPYEVTFDGGARSFGDHPKVAGAGATLWEHPVDGGARILRASCAIALPSTDNAQLAEASACWAGLALLTGLPGHPRAARIV